MRTIWKFSVSNAMKSTNPSLFDIPIGSRLIHVREVKNDLVMWFEVDPKETKERRKFEIYSSESPPNQEVRTGLSYIGTGIFASGNVVIHLYEVKETERVYETQR